MGPNRIFEFNNNPSDHQHSVLSMDSLARSLGHGSGWCKDRKITQRFASAEGRLGALCRRIIHASDLQGFPLGSADPVGYEFLCNTAEQGGFPVFIERYL